MSRLKITPIEKSFYSNKLGLDVLVRFNSTYDFINMCQQSLFENLDSTFEFFEKETRDKIFIYYQTIYSIILPQLKNYSIKGVDINEFMPPPTTSEELAEYYKIQYVRLPDQESCSDGLITIHFEVSWDGNSNLPVYIKQNKIIKVGNLDF